MPAVEKIINGMWKGKTDANAALVDALVVRLADRTDELKPVPQAARLLDELRMMVTACVIE